jgi:hypothetical protein
MEFDMQWDGNPDIVLAIKTKVGTTCAGNSQILDG